MGSAVFGASNGHLALRSVVRLVCMGALFLGTEQEQLRLYQTLPPP